MTNTTKHSSRQRYAFLDSVFYHGPNVKLAVNIALQVTVLVAVVAGTIKYMVS